MEQNTVSKIKYFIKFPSATIDSISDVMVLKFALPQTAQSEQNQDVLNKLTSRGHKYPCMEHKLAIAHHFIFLH